MLIRASFELSLESKANKANTCTLLGWHYVCVRAIERKRCCTYLCVCGGGGALCVCVVCVCVCGVCVCVCVCVCVLERGIVCVWKFVVFGGETGTGQTYCLIKSFTRSKAIRTRAVLYCVFIDCSDKVQDHCKYNIDKYYIKNIKTN